MSRPTDHPRPALAAACAALVVLTLVVTVRAGEEDPPPRTGERLESYLAERELREPLIAHLRDRLRRAGGEERDKVAARLAEIYTQALRDAETSEERQRFEALSRDLLQAVPRGESHELRINLARIGYNTGESTAERHRLRLADPEEVEEAVRLLNDSNEVFRDVADSVNRRLEQLLRRRDRARTSQAREFDDEIDELRRLRSLARYYAGWSNYYIAYMTDSAQHASRALQDFAWLVNTEGRRVPTHDRLPRSLLRYEHVSRAAIGVGLAHSLRSADAEALRWLDIVHEASEVPSGVREQLFARRLLVYAEAARWSDAFRLVRVERGGDDERTGSPLSPSDARLLAVLTLEAIDNDRRHPDEHTQRLARLALSDLGNRGEISHVVDLVDRYDAAEIAGEGFIARYVNTLRTYERARDAHADEPDADTDLPAAEARTRELYIRAGRDADEAVEAEDAGRFIEQRAHAALLAGRARYFADRLERAADLFDAAAELAENEQQIEDARWNTVIALDRAVEDGHTALRERRDRALVLFIRAYPGTERAARLLVRTGDEPPIDPEEAVQILLAVDADSSVYTQARQIASTLLYRIYRTAGSKDREYAASRFLEIAENSLRAEIRAAMDARGDERIEQIARRAILRARQIAEVALGKPSPEPRRAEAALQRLHEVASFAGLDTEEWEGELLYRQLQIAMLQENDEQVEALASQFDEHVGGHAGAARRLLFRHAAEQFSASSDDPEAARLTIQHGEPLIRILDDEGRTEAAASVRRTVAEAAYALWQARGDEQAKALAVRIGQELTTRNLATAADLARNARLMEDQGRSGDALEAWRRVLAGVQEGTPPWFEARYHSIRLLAEFDPERAGQVFAQFRVLHPGMGGPNWSERFRELGASLDDSETPPERGS